MQLFPHALFAHQLMPTNERQPLLHVLGDARSTIPVVAFRASSATRQMFDTLANRTIAITHTDDDFAAIIARPIFAVFVFAIAIVITFVAAILVTEMTRINDAIFHGEGTIQTQQICTSIATHHHCTLIRAVECSATEACSRPGHPLILGATANQGFFAARKL